MSEQEKEMSEHANADQINAMSEMVLNLSRNRISVHPITMAKLHRSKTTLREIGKRRNSVKRTTKGWRILARIKQRVPSMSMLIARDVNGCPLQGYDLVPERPKPTPKDILRELIKLLQQANRREEKLKESLDFWNRKYHSLYQEHLAYKLSDLRTDCQTRRENAGNGGCYEVCDECTHKLDTIASLKRELVEKDERIRYWIDCYETLLQQYFDNDRRSNAGAHERI